MDYSNIEQAGRLTSDPEFQSLPTGTTLVKFTIATNRKYSGKEDVTFIDVKFFGETNAKIADFFHKGDNIFVQGELIQEKWEKDGQKFRRHVIMGSRWRFVDSKGTGEQTRQQPAAPPANTTPPVSTARPAASGVAEFPPGYDPFADDDVPAAGKSFEAPF